MENKKELTWFKQHADTITTISFIIGAVLWMTSQFSTMRTDFDARFTAIEKDICVIKTVLVMKNIMPSDMAKKEK